jgi:hypothetical protein
MTSPLADDGGAIADWVRSVAADRGDLRFDDLHIDVVDGRFARKRQWVSGAIECLAAATEIRDAHKLPFAVAAGLSLQSGASPLGLNFSDADGLQAQLADQAPSLYLFAPPVEALLDDPECREVGDLVPLPVPQGTRRFLREWMDARDHEFRRSFWLLAL